MMLTFAAAAMVGAMAAAPPAEQSRDTRPAQTDQTVPVTRGTRLSLDSYAGEVLVRAWDKDAVHVVARHGSRAKVSVRQSEAGLQVSSTGAVTGSVDYDITAPAWMPVKVEGQFTFINVEGIQADVSAASVRGDIVIRGGSGFVVARSVQGEVTIEGARGKITANSVNEGVTITGCGGEIVADTTNGSIDLGRIDATSVEVTTVNGDVTFDGVPAANGRYRMSTHNGDIIVGVPESSNVTFFVRTYNGDFKSALPTKGPAAREASRGRRVQYVLGTGSAEMELESFGGEIQLQRQGTARPKPKEKDKEKQKD